MYSKTTILPLRNCNGYHPIARRKVLKSTERYMMYLIFLIFLTLCYCAFFLIPDLRDRMKNVQGSAYTENVFIPQVDRVRPGVISGHHQLKNPEEDFHLRPAVNLTIGQDKALQEPWISKPIEVLNQNHNVDVVNETVKHKGDSPKESIVEQQDDIKAEIHETKEILLTEKVDQKQEENEAEKNADKAHMEVEGYIKQSDGEPRDSQSKQRRDKVREMMLHAWGGYETYVWGANELKPISHVSHSTSMFGNTNMGATIVDGIDTLFIMGLKEQYEKARKWIAHEFNFNPNGDVSVFEINIRYIGGLLSIYALTKDEMFKNKSVEISDILLPAFNTPTGIPFGLFNVKTGKGKNPNWASGGCSILAEFGTLHLEFSYLTEITGESKYLEKVQKIRETLDSIDKVDGLYPNYLHPHTGRWGETHVSLGALGDSFYEYLLKSYIMSAEVDQQALQMYNNTIISMEKKMKQTSDSGFIFFGDFRKSKVDQKMGHLSCFSGGMFALGSKYAKDPQHYIELGANVTETCHKAYNNSATKLGPEVFQFKGNLEAVALSQNEKYYILRPETVESYFVMWRLTKDPKYRDWAWEAVQALEKNCRVDAGFSGIKDVYASNVVHDDVQQSFFLAETLKYLYLIFSDDDFISLNDWVFNTEAHPLPIKT